MNSIKIHCRLLLVLTLFSSSLWAVNAEAEANDEAEADGLLSALYDDQEPETAASERSKRAARGGGRGGSSSKGSSRGSSKGSSKGSSRGGGGSKGKSSYKKGSLVFHNVGGNRYRAIKGVTSYIKSLSGTMVKLDRFMKGFSMTTPKKIFVSVNPLGKTVRGSQPIRKIESKVRFQAKESDFLYYKIRGGRSKTFFHLVLMEQATNFSKLYLGYYEEDEDRVINVADSRATPAPVFLRDVLGRPDEPDTAINGTAINSTASTPHSGQSLNDTFTNATVNSRNATGLWDLMSKRPDFKLFRPILSLDKEQEYSIEVAWISIDAAVVGQNCYIA